MKKIIGIYEDRRKQMGKAGRQKILKEFDDKIVIAKYLEVICSVPLFSNIF